MADPWVVLGAAVIEGVVGYPDALNRRFPHPVTWLGRVIGELEHAWNKPESSDRRRRWLGVATLASVTGAAGIVGLTLDRLAPGWLVALLGAFGLAARSLHDHVRPVLMALSAHDLPAAREAVGRIVGRDTAELDEAGVAAAALESLAESFNDGVVAPLFWFLIGGLGGLFAYKAINTADSLIGHREERWRAFGWAAARTDDVVNFVPARLAGALICLVGGAGWRVMLRDAPKHASPNAGWPEAAMAGTLEVTLGGPATYDGVLHDRPALGQGRRPTPEDLATGLHVYRWSLAVLAILLLVGGALWRL